MNVEEAISFIQKAVTPPSGNWADIGAGTGIFSEALLHLLIEGTVIAVDKSPHALYKIKSPSSIHFEIIEADFNLPFSLPPLDGILMANALHYAPSHENTLHHVLSNLKAGGTFILIEYNTTRPNHPWVPYPINQDLFFKLCRTCGLETPEIIATRKSIYQDGDIYLAKTSKL